MLSLFYKILENKIPQGIFITIIKPYKEKQIIIIKGKYGQFMLNWSMFDNIKYQTIWIQKYIENNKNDVNNFIKFKKENKLFIYDKKINKIKNVIYLNKIVNINIFDKIKNIYNLENSLFDKNNHIGYKYWLNKELIHEIDNKIYIGYILYLKNKNNKNINNLYQLKNKNNLDKQIKNIYKGLIQGYSINLELKGIGYTAKLINITYNNKEISNLIARNNNSIGYYESNINKINKFKYVKNNKIKILNNEKNIILITNNIINKKLYIFYNLKLFNKNIIIKNKLGIYNYLNIKNNYINYIKNNIIIRLGTSHNIILPFYDINIKILQNDNINLILFGIYLNTIKKIAAKIYLLKKPEPYKGKGIRYDGDKLLLKKIK